MREPDAKTLLQHAEFLRALAWSILRDEHAAEDVAQEALLAAGRGPRVKAWLGAVARNLAISRLRADRRRARREEALARPESHGDVPEAVARLEAQQRVVEAVLALEPPYREVVLERFFYDRKIPEVAARLGVPVGTARTRLRRALATLRARLERRMGPAALVAALSLLARPAAAAGSTGAILMSTKTKIAVAVVLIAGTAWFLFSTRGGPAAGARGAAGRSGAPATLDAPDVAAAAPATHVAGPLVTGRCVDSFGATPLEGVRVRIGDGEATTDATGHFVAPWPEASAATTFVASREGYADAVAILPGERDDVDVGEIPMRPLLVLRGVVITPEGAPAKRALVILREGDQLSGRVAASTAADDAGRFRVPVPDRAAVPGPVRDHAPLLVAAFLPGFMEGIAAVDDPDAELRIRLGPARAVRGVVVDESTGEGVPGAELFVTPFKTFLGNGWRAAVTGSDGSFEAWVHPLPDREGLVVPGMDVRAKGYVPRQLAPADLAADGNRIALAPSATVRGRVTRADGRPAARIEVTSVGLVAHRLPSQPEMVEFERRVRGGPAPRFDVTGIDCRTQTDDAGEFTIEVPRAPPFRISAAATSLGAEADFTAFPNEPVALVLRVLEGHGLVPVHVVDAEGRPLEGAAVTWWALPGAEGEGMGGRSPGIDARTGADGCAEVWTGAGWTKPVLLVAWAPGWFGVSREPVDRQRLAGAAEVVCEPAGVVRGRVAGAPLPHAARASLWWRVGGETPWRVQFVRVARDGRFELPGAPPGRSLLVIADPRGRSLLREIDVRGALLDLGDIDLEAPAITRGIVRTEGGEPAAGAWVWWEPSDPFYRQVFVDPYWDRVKADGTGAFEIPVWVQGTVIVFAQGGPFTVLPEGVPHGGVPFPRGGAASAECRPGDGLTLVTGGRR